MASEMVSRRRTIFVCVNLSKTESSCVNRGRKRQVCRRKLFVERNSFRFICFVTRGSI